MTANVERGFRLTPRSLRAAATLFFLATALVAGPAEAQRVRVIVLSFEGADADDARSAAIRGLETTYEMVDEQAAIDAAGEIGVDVSTPDGMSAVVAHLGIELVIGGFVEGRGRRATTTVWVSDTNGNELARRTSGAPTGRGAGDLIASAAYDAAAEALIILHPPELIEEEEEHHDDTPIFVPEEDDHVVTPPSDTGPRSNRWVQPLIRGLVGLDLRNRTAGASPGDDRFDADFFPVIELAFDAHPLSFLQGPENGLYLSLRMGFSAGLTYTPVNEEPGLAMNVYHLEFDAGYSGIIANIFELGGTLGLGLDGIGLTAPLPSYLPGDYPSVEFFNFRPAIFARVRAFQDYLIIAGGFGGRVLLGAGQINNFDDVVAVPARPPPRDLVYWGIANGGGFDFNIGLEGIIDPGFSYAARFGYTGYFIGFAGDDIADAERNSATDEAWHILLQVGWAYVPGPGPAMPGETIEDEPRDDRELEHEAPPDHRDGGDHSLDEYDHLDNERPPDHR